MYSFIRTALCVLAAVALCAGTANAAVTFTHQYSFGDNDPGSVIGNVGNPTTVDNIAGMNMTRYGSPTYTAGAPGAGGTKAIQLTNTWGDSLKAQNYYEVRSTGTLVPTFWNWGVDFWVKIDSLAPSGEAEYFATIGGGGYSQDNNTDWGLKMGVKTVGSVGRFTMTDFCGYGAEINYDVPLNTWVHLAYVNKTPLAFAFDAAALDSGDAHLFIDGVDGAATYGASLTRCIPYMWKRGLADGSGPHPDYTTVMPNKITLGGILFNHPSYDNGLSPHRSFSGAIDGLRVFTFGEGQFNIQDLTVPEPGTLALLVAGLFGVLVYAWRKRK